MSQPGDGMTAGEERSETSPPPRPRLAVAAYLGWGVGIGGLVVAVGIALWAQRQFQALRGELTALRQAVIAARQVFLRRASDELGYASVDLEGNLPNRYQASFRIGEALRWLQDAEPLLSPDGRWQVASLRQTLSQLTVTAEQDPGKAREELAKVRDLLERLIRMETHLK